MWRKRGGDRTWKSCRLGPGPPSSQSALGLTGPNLVLSQEESPGGGVGSGGRDEGRGLF